MLFLLLCLLLVQILVTVTRYILSAYLKWFVPSTQIKKDFEFQPSVSVLLPCFNEGKTVYDTIQSIARSDYPHESLEVIAIDDCSVDDSYEWMLKAAQEFSNIKIQVSKNEHNSGKSKTILRALALSQAEIVITIDSDCIFAPDAVQEMVSCFSDPLMGAVGGRVGVSNVNESATTIYQTLLYYVCYHLFKIPENWTKTVTCISGCLFAIRRPLLLEIEPKIHARKWFGLPVDDGEDRFITHQVLLHGYKTYINLNAQCWTKVPKTVAQYIKQQTRWRRSGLRDFFWTVKTLPAHVWDLHPNAVYTLIVPPLAMFVCLFGLLIAPFFDMTFWMDLKVVVVYLMVFKVLYLAMRKYNPEQVVEHPLWMVVFGPWWVINSLFITMLALCSFDSSDWGTRAKKGVV